MDVIHDFYDKVEEFLHEYLKINPIMGTYLGLHEYDPLLPKGGWEGLRGEEDFIKRFKSWLIEFSKSIDVNLSLVDLRIDLELLKRTVRLWEFQMYNWRLWAKYPSAPDTVNSSVFILFGREFAPYEVRIESIISRLEKAPDYLRRSREILVEPVKKYVDIAIEIASRASQFLDFLIHTSHSILGDSDKVERLRNVSDKLKDKVEDYIEWLNDVRRDADDEYRIGRELFEELISIRELGFNGDEILQLGYDYLAKFKEEAKKLAIEISGTDDINRAREIVESEYPRDFNEVLKLYKDSIERAKKFILENNIAPIPEGEYIKVLETPPFMAPIIPFAAYMGPAPYEDRKEGIYFVTRPSKERDLRRHNIYSISNTTVHEAYPGHHLQMVWAAKVRNLPRLIALDTAFVEGWAHYCEDLMKEYGYDDTPKHRFIQVIDSIWRAVRIIVDVKLSRGEISFEDAIDMLVRETGMDRNAAEAEVKRYILSPSYQLSYLLGRHLFSKLRREVKEVLGDRYSDYKFHKVILESCGLPFKYLKELVINKILTK